jgi:hypothetical protein
MNRGRFVRCRPQPSTVLPALRGVTEAPLNLGRSLAARSTKILPRGRTNGLARVRYSGVEPSITRAALGPHPGLLRQHSGSTWGLPHRQARVSGQAVRVLGSARGLSRHGAESRVPNGPENRVIGVTESESGGQAARNPRGERPCWAPVAVPSSFRRRRAAGQNEHEGRCASGGAGAHLPSCWGAAGAP